MRRAFGRAEHLRDTPRSGEPLTEKRETGMPRNGYTPILQPGLLEPCAVKVARTVRRGAGTGNRLRLPDNSSRRFFALSLGATRVELGFGDAINDPV